MAAAAARQRRATASPEEHRERELRNARRRRHYARRRRCEGIAPTLFTGEIVHMLVVLGWLAEADCEDRRRIGTAISRLLEDAARNCNA